MTRLYSFDDTDTSDAGHAGIKTVLPDVIMVAASDETTDLSTGTGKVTFRMPFAMTLTEVVGSLNVAGTVGEGAGLVTFDVNKNGTTIFTTRPTFDDTEKTTRTAAVSSVLDVTALAQDDIITIDIDTVGSGDKGKGLKVSLIGVRT